MKLITAIIKPFKLADVETALRGLGIEGLTVSEVRGYGRQKGHTEVYRGAEYEVTLVPKVKIEIALSDQLADRAAEVIREAAGTGQIGDGKIFIVDLLKAIRIRTGEINEAAL